MRTPPADLLKKHNVFVPSDTAFQRKARLLQALWREERQLPIGPHRGRSLGSRLPPEMAENTLSNFLTAGIREIVRREVRDAPPGSPKLYAKPRIYNDLLSSQPLALNLFGELSLDLDLATRLFSELWPQAVEKMLRIEFEFSPARGSPRFTADASAFDVFAVHTTPGGGVGFVGIEVKYHEWLRDDPASHKPRYDVVADAMEEFVGDRAALRMRPLQQIWRDHLLSGALRLFGRAEDIGEPGAGGIESGLFVFLAPSGNSACSSAVQAYQDHLTGKSTFAAISIEEVIERLERHSDAPWLRQFRDRYLAWEKVESLLATSER